MIITQEKKKVVQSHDFESVNCTIDAEDMRYVASLLRNNYSNTTLAVVREITANALDANSEANVTSQIEIKLPTNMNPTFAVRDFGGGLSQEDIFGLYSKYGKSTKRDSNNYIGAFGIGKFAPLSYGDSFTCVSYHGGKKISYNVFVNDDDDTKIVKMDEESNCEPTGLNIEVAVADGDVDSFRKVVQKFFEFFPQNEMPKFIGVEDDFISPREVLLGSDDEQWFFVTENDSSKYGYYHSTHNSHVVMGRVTYPLDPNAINLNNYIKDEAVRRICENLLGSDNFYLRVPLGEVRLHHSRESLEYNKSTQKTIARHLVDASKGVQEIAKKKLADSDDLFDAKMNYARVVNAMPHNMKNIFENAFEWNGIKITSPSFQRKHQLTEELIITQSTKTGDSEARNGYKVQSCKVNRTHCDKDVLYGVQDIVSSHGNNLRARTLFDENEDIKVIYFINPVSKVAEDYMKDEWHFDLIDSEHIFYTSEVEKQKPNRTGVRQSKGKNSRANIPLFVMTEDKGYARRLADYWENFKDQINDLDDGSIVEGSFGGKMIYVPIKNFNVVCDEGYDLDHVYNKMSQIRSFSESQEDCEYKGIKLFGVRTGDVKKLDSDIWVSFFDIYLDYCKYVLSTDKKQTELAHRKQIFHENDVSDKLSKYGYSLSRLFTNKTFKLNSLANDHLLNRVLTSWQALEQENFSQPINRALCEIYRKDKEWVKNNYPIDEGFSNVFVSEVESVVESYPLLVVVSKSFGSWDDLRVKEDEVKPLKEVLNYIQMCDNQGVGE
jgi:hypothetical protein